MKDYIKEFIIIFRYALLRRFFTNKIQLNSEFYRKGFALHSEKVDEKSTEKLRAFIDSAIDDDNVNVWRDSFDSDKRIYGVEKLLPEVEKLLPINEMRKKGEDYLSCKLPYFFVLAAKLDYKHGNIGSGGGWHRDSPFTPQFKFITYLSDVDETNGPFEYIPYSHLSVNKFHSKFKLSKMRYTDCEVENEWGKGSTVCANKGSTLVADTRGVHRGLPIKDGTRYACTVYFFNSKENYDSFSNLFQSK